MTIKSKELVACDESGEFNLRESPAFNHQDHLGRQFREQIIDQVGQRLILVDLLIIAEKKSEAFRNFALYSITEDVNSKAVDAGERRSIANKLVGKNGCQRIV